MKLWMVLACGVALLAGCSENSKSTDEKTPAAGQSVQATPPLPSLATPEDAIRAMIAAAEAKDIEGLSRCFSKESPGEFAAFVNKTATAEELEEFAEFMRGAEVGTAKIEDDEAFVPVSLTSRKENITMKKEGGDWKILDF